MIPELTLFNGIAAVIGVIGLTLLVNALRYGFLDEAGIGGILLVIAWWLL